MSKGWTTKPRNNTGSNRNGIDTQNSAVYEDPKRVIEANEGLGVGIYDARGAVNWGLVGAITSKDPRVGLSLKHL